MADKGLNVSPGLVLPLDAITQSIALLAVRRAGKALALDTKVPTPAGWSTMGELRCGDQVFNEQGSPCTVTDVWPVLHNRPCFEITFSDGSVIVADAEHQWLADTKRSRRWYHNGWANKVCAEIVTTERMAATLKAAGGRENNYSIPVAAPLRGMPAALPIPPYTLGAWLGDGASATGSITSADPEIIGEIEAEGETVWVIPSTAKENHASYRVKHLEPRLGSLGLRWNKHIPLAYLRASEDQRRALLAGLLDTDGYASKRGHIEFCSTKERLAQDVYHLVASLGYKPTLRSKIARFYGKPCGTVWTIGFRSPDKVFRLPRKVARQIVAGAPSGRRYVVTVNPVPSVPVRCIAVDSPNHLYLIGEACIPTHNSNAAAVVAEEMHHAGLPWVAIDPKGDWWGLRSSKDGTGPGLPIPIFGGLHGDMPLLPEAGHLIAELIVEHNLTCVLDVSEFASKAAQMRFLTDLGERLFRLHGKHPQPRHLFLEEADDFIPQVVRAEMARCVGAWTKIVKQGGSRGLGITMVSQRSAVVAKDALTQAETLIALRTTSPQDRKAIAGWVDYHAVARELVDSLPGLDDGEAWVCSPHWLGRHGQPPIQRIRFRQRATFDSGATPAMRQARRPATLADIDLGALQGRMEAVVEKAAQDDPKALRRKIAELERRLAASAGTDARVAALQAEADGLRAELAKTLARPAERVTVPVLAPDAVAGLERVAETLRTVAEVVGGHAASVTAVLHHAEGATPSPALAAVPRPAAVTAPATAPKATVASPVPPASNGTGPEPLVLSKAHRAVLAVLAQFPEGRTKRQIAMLTGYSSKSGGFNGTLAGLRSAELVHRGDPVVITEAGIAALGDEWEPLPTGAALIDYWMAQLARAEGGILRVLLDAYPDAVPKAEIAARLDYSPTSGGFNGALARLRGLLLVEDSKEGLRADETLAQHAPR